MAYKYEDRLYANSVVRSITENVFIETGETKEIKEVYRKAKAMDEIEQAYWKSNTPENFAYEFVVIFEKHFSNGVERADDER
ncbi:hypothetical protein [Staphylococcus saprophyticus]|uniref:hypothetical protein n=1 Tax=Staphylococcus saprophyticus TaxID=29385 RepID=UPI0009905BCA|nr:hypothetical protein [Staphylococcus saprophyticus]OOO72393.1 hypothetical protein B0W56_00460 [Staphylococcus saprophyticus]